MRVDKFSHVRFEPSGITKNRDVRVAKSIVDYIFRWMATKFLSREAQYHAGVNVDVAEAVASVAETVPSGEGGTIPEAPFAIQNDQDAPPCSTCGSIMIRNGSCYKSVNCGATSGCA